MIGMSRKLQEIIKACGFDFDPKDCNFYGRPGWINHELISLVNAIVDECIENATEDPHVLAKRIKASLEE